jgi:uncharacterized membrane protein YgdD (TMEM256/DUF423 family)
MNKFFFSALLGATSVILGAFAAHGLKPIISPDKLASFDTGTKYQLIHSVLLIFISILSVKYPHKLINTAFYSIFSGVVFFSGSIYLLTLKEIIGIHFYQWLIPVTPLGGILIITGWCLLAIWGLKHFSSVKDR